MHRSLLLLPFALLAVLPAPAAAQADPRAAEVDRIFAAWDRPSSPGCAVGVLRNGELILSRGYGTANLDHDVPITPSTVFYVASVSKQFTAATMALLAADGKLSLDDDVRRYIPELPDYGDRITIRHLIHHTSGIRDYLTLMGMAGMRLADTHSNAEVLELVARQKELNFRPGERYLYNNSGYFLMSEIVQRVTGKSLREFAEERIFRPLRMRDTHFHDDHTMVVRSRALSYAPTGRRGFRLDYWANFDKVGSGGVLTTVEDLARWDRNFDDPRVGGSAFLRQILTRGVLNSGDTLNYAFGLTHSDHGGLRTVEHSGSSMGFRAQFMRFPDQRLSVITLCNLGTTEPVRLARRVADVYLGRSYTAAVAEESGPPPREVRERHTTPEQRSRLAGSFHNDEVRSTYSILERDGRLFLRRRAASDTPLIYIGDDTFRAGSWELKFAGDGRSFTVNAGRAYGIRFERTDG